MGFGFLVIWLILFILNKNSRKEMLIMSSIFAVAGPVADILYTKDWWRPLTITNTVIGPEALLVGFMIGGIASVVYTSLIRGGIKILKASGKKELAKNLNFVYMILISVLIFFGSFYLLKFNSLLATSFALSIPTIFIWIKRKDLIINSLITGMLLVVIASLVYTFLELLTPGWINAFWFFKNIPNVVIFNLPADDIIWYFLAGLFVGPLYEFWQKGKLIKN